MQLWCHEMSILLHTPRVSKADKCAQSMHWKGRSSYQTGICHCPSLPLFSTRTHLTFCKYTNITIYSGLALKVRSYGEINVVKLTFMQTSTLVTNEYICCKNNAKTAMKIKCYNVKSKRKVKNDKAFRSSYYLQQQIFRGWIGLIRIGQIEFKWLRTVWRCL